MENVFGCGIDIEELIRFDKFLANDDYSLIEDICTKREFDNLCKDKRTRFALSFSCKEAFFKALGVSWTNSSISWRDIELLFAGPDFNDYHVQLSGHARDMLLKNNARIGEMSFDYNDEFVMFQVVLMKNSDNER